MESNSAYSTRVQRKQSNIPQTLTNNDRFLQEAHYAELVKAEKNVINAFDDNKKIQAQLQLNEVREKYRLSTTSFLRFFVSS